MFIGLDFGTTNSALALAGATGPSRLVPLLHNGVEHSTFRSILYFDADERDKRGKPLSYAGPAAIDAYLEPGAEGRLIQSIKSYLANPDFTSTSIYNSRYTLENLIGLLVSRLLEATPDAGDLMERLKSMPIVVGRPARFVRNSLGQAQEGQDDFAVSRLLASLEGAGLADVHFEFEPVAAAYAYEAGLNQDELVLIGDFGGGTSDFCLLHVGPGMRAVKNRAETIIGVSGVGIAGDAFDARIVENVIAPRLGRGSSYKSTGGKVLPMPAWLYDSLKRWHQLSFINTQKTRRMLEEILPVSDAPAEIEALTHLIEENKGFEMYRAVEAAKVALSGSTKAHLSFMAAPIAIEADIERGDFDRWVAPELAEIGGCVDRLLEDSGTSADKIDRVFLTGGTSFIPAVRALFAERFGREKLAGGGELTSVATGLALSARQRFAA
ncbi:Hsp70 family protein [Parvibaculum sedimenti]|uniref:Hsp70 family protein n=1 Tax=Parvibaculum sedimenti TaxID=2608632 RepID=A0A6N6VQT5_9HYPH|nr:Hsp70 family protein [Parvibaculum sedimenti]KAB7741576.1 Hsp70 family protein [Parvibaculum sedimenti]